MTWFKVDDGLHSHRKVLAIPRSGRASAMGLWVLAGSWSADGLSDGRIPAYMVAELGCTPRNAQHLVDVGLWIEVDGDYQFHAWNEPGRQPTRAEVEANREAERKRKAEYRARVSQRDSDGTDGGTDSTQGLREPRPRLDRGEAEARPGFFQHQVDNLGAEPGTAYASPESRSDQPMSQRDNDGSPSGTDNGTPTGVRTPRPDPTRPVLNRVTGSQSLNGDNARENGDGPDLTKIAQELHQPLPWATRVAHDVLSRAGPVTNPTAYILSAIRGEPQRYQPTAEPPPVSRLCDHGRDRLTCIHCAHVSPEWTDQGDDEAAQARLAQRERAAAAAANRQDQP